LMDGRGALPNPAAVGRFAPNCTAAVLRTPANVRRNIFFPFSGGATAFFFPLRLIEINYENKLKPC